MSIVKKTNWRYDVVYRHRVVAAFSKYPDAERWVRQHSVTARGDLIRREG